MLPFLQLLASPALQGDPYAPAITAPLPGQVIDYAEDDGGAITTVSWTGNPSPDYTLTGVDAALFAMSGDELTWADAPDYETPLDDDGDNVYDVTVVADNGVGSFEVSFAVRVVNAIDVAPTITFPTASPVQVPSGRAAAFTGRSSDDAASRTWAITGGADAALFAVVASTGRVSFLAAPDFEAPADADTDNDYELTLSVTTTAGVDTQAVVVRVVEAAPDSSRPLQSHLIGTDPTAPASFTVISGPSFDV